MTNQRAIRVINVFLGTDDLCVCSEDKLHVSCNECRREAADIAINALKGQKTGKWIHGREIAREMIGDCITAIFYEGWKCSECECVVEEEREPLWKYCPNCGARMIGEEDD